MTVASVIRRTAASLLTLVAVSGPAAAVEDWQVAQLVPVEPYWPGMIEMARPSRPAVPPAGPLAQVSGWTGGPVKSKDGGFLYCVIEAEYETGHALIIARNSKGEINLGIGMPGVDLPVESGWKVEIRIDDLLERERAAVTPEPQMLVIPNGMDNDLYSALMRGRALQIRSNADRITFNLKGTRRALNELRNCADKGLAGQPISVS